ncbi:MAG: NlpC/P60 family protein [Pseudomonadota bacterium]
MAAPLDRRRNAYREDLADARLRGRVDAARYVDGAPALCAAPLSPCKATPDAAAPTLATYLHGEPLRVFERREDGWAWAQSDRDGYVGYVRAADLGPPAPAGAAQATRRVTALRAHRYPEPNFKAPPLNWAPLGAKVRVTGQEEPGGPGDPPFTETAEGWMPSRHLSPLDAVETDWVAVAERFLGAPYVWGGESVDGIDCSGLVQVALEQCGLPCPRDADMQAAELGDALGLDTRPERGDFVFWRGHVALMRDAEMLLHASASVMEVWLEQYDAALERIAETGGGQPTAIRRVKPRRSG